MVPSNAQQSLLAEAFQALLEKMGPEKAVLVWQLLVIPQGEDYLKIRKKIFTGKTRDNIVEGVKKFNRKTS